MPDPTPPAGAPVAPVPDLPPSAAVLRADIEGRQLSLDPALLARHLAALPAGAPIVAMIHGWRYAPGRGDDCPHATILSPAPPPQAPRAVSWPGHLGLDGRHGLGIAIGWQAFCPPGRAFLRAGAAAEGLAALARMLAALAPGRPLDVIAHSMGARVALGALPLVPAGCFGRLILLAPAETRAAARRAIASPAGQAAEIVNVITRENDLFDFLFEWGIRWGLDTSVGQGLGPTPGSGAAAQVWHDLWIDDPRSRAALAALGHPLPAPAARVCHWSPYLRAGVFALYRALLDRRIAPSQLPVGHPGRRWSHLLTPRLPRTAPLGPAVQVPAGSSPAPSTTVRISAPITT